MPDHGRVIREASRLDKLLILSHPRYDNWDVTERAM
nr:MAG TPA: hypothetical protein [Caudoviricetes sp.]